MRTFKTFSYICVVLAIMAGTSYSQEVVCYNKGELTRIAERLARANECDTLLSIANADIEDYETIIYNLEEVVVLKDSIITLHLEDLKVCNDNMNKTQEKIDKYKKKLTRTRWIAGGTGILAIVGILIAILL